VVVIVHQLSVGLGSQQGLHARQLPCAGGHHQGGLAGVGLMVGVGRVLQQEEHDGVMAEACGSHERTKAEPGLQVNARASLQQLPHNLQVASHCGDVQHACRRDLAASSRNRAHRVDRPTLVQPLDHLVQLASLR